jgi:recombination protein RecA
MANVDKQAILRLCKQINSKEGEGAIRTLNSGTILKIPRWSSGMEDFDHIIGGGVPKGRIIEIFGPESSGKTSLGYQLASQCPVSYYIPIEGTFDSERAKSFGNKNMLISSARYGEQAMNEMVQFAEKGIPLIILDSVPACKPKEDIDKLMASIRSGKNEAVNERMGGVARLMHKYLPVLERITEVSGTTIILINQVRDKMDAMMFGEKTDTPGGRAPKFYSSIRIQLARRAWIEIPNKDPRSSAEKEKIGLIMKCKVVKSKVCNPMMEAEIPMFFDRGFTSFDDIKEIRSELMQKSGKRKAKYVEDDEDGDEEE